ncbi:hypothetical protein ScPMuIL_011786 [Solemya velum]
MADLHKYLLNEENEEEEDFRSEENPTSNHYQITSTPEIDVDIGKSNIDIEVYHRRWYVLALYSSLAMCQGGFWNTWGPIAKVSEDAFGWEDSTIALLINWGPITYIFSTFFFAWLTSEKGLRWACVVAMVLIAGGAGVRCISSTPPVATGLIHFGQILNGLAGPVGMSVPPVLSAKWFPPHQRTTATAIACVFNSLGVAISFVIGPYMVPEQNHDNSSSTNMTNESWEDVQFSPFLNQNTSTNRSDSISTERKDIMNLMYVEAGWAVFLLLLMLIYFPAMPPKPPSVTASIGRLNFKTGLKMLVKNGQFWLVGVTYFIPQGINQVWGSVLDINLKPHGISQNEAGWLGFYAIIAGISSSFIIAWFADMFSKHIKWFILIAMVPAAGFYLWFTLIFTGVAPSNTASIYSSIILGGLFLQSLSPLYFEVTSEITFPVPEAISVYVLTLLDNISGLIFLGTQQILNKSTAWENWANFGAIVACIPVLLLFKESYKRLTIDEAPLK